MSHHGNHSHFGEQGNFFHALIDKAAIQTAHVERPVILHAGIRDNTELQ